MSKAKVRSLIYAAICAVLFGLSLSMDIAIWFLFLALAIYYGYKAFAKVPAVNADEGPVEPVSYGKLGRYAVDGDPNDLSYGMYIQLRGKPVFVDLREDRYLEGRKKRAVSLHANTQALENGLKQFISSNPEFQDRVLKSIGLHSDDMERAEVFWEPEGYSLLRGLQFVRE